MRSLFKIIYLYIAFTLLLCGMATLIRQNKIIIDNVLSPYVPSHKCPKQMLGGGIGELDHR